MKSIEMIIAKWEERRQVAKDGLETLARINTDGVPIAYMQSWRAHAAELRREIQFIELVIEDLRSIKKGTE